MARRKRPRPVLYFGAALAGLQALALAADIYNIMPEVALNWLRVLVLVGGAVFGALYVQGKVTPLSDPVDADGNRLRPVTRRQAAGHIPGPPATFTTGAAPVRRNVRADDDGTER